MFTRPLTVISGTLPPIFILGRAAICTEPGAPLSVLPVFTLRLPVFAASIFPEVTKILPEFPNLEVVDDDGVCMLNIPLWDT